MSCDVELLQPSKQHFHQHEDQRTLCSSDRVGFLPKTSSNATTLSATTTTILVDRAYKGEDEDDENVERCRKDSGINSSSKVSSDADQSSGANFLLSDQEAASGVGERGDRVGRSDALAEDLCVGAIKRSDGEERGKSIQGGAIKEIDPSKERLDVCMTSSFSTKITSTVTSSPTTRTLMETAFEDDDDEAPALPIKERKRSKMAGEKGENKTSFDSVSSSCTGGVDSGGRGGFGYDTGNDCRCTDDTSNNDTLDDERRRGLRDESFVKGNSVGAASLKTGRDGSDDDYVRSGKNGGADGGRVFRRGVGGGSFEIGSAGDLNGITGIETGTLRPYVEDGRWQSKSVGNVFRQSSSQTLRGSGMAEEVELDFTSAAAVRLFQSCCENGEESQTTALSRPPSTQHAPPQRTAPRNVSRPASQVYLPQQQRRIVNQQSRESYSSDCISGSSLAQAKVKSLRDVKGGGAALVLAGGESGSDGLHPLSSSRIPTAKSKPYMRLNSDEGPQPPSSSSASASLSRLCSSQEVVGERNPQQSKPPSSRRSGGSTRGRSASKSNAQQTLNNVELFLRDEASSCRGGKVTGRDSTHIATNFVQSPTNVEDDFDSKPVYRRLASDLENDSRRKLIRDGVREDQGPNTRHDLLRQRRELRPQESKRRSNPEGSAQPLLVSSDSASSNHNRSGILDRKPRPPMTSSVPAALPLLSSTPPPPPRSSALQITANASSLANNAPSSSVVFVSSSSSSFAVNAPHVVSSGTSHRPIVHPTQYHPFSHPDHDPSPPTRHPNLVFSSSYVSEEDLADRHRYQHHHYHRHSRGLPRHYHLSTSSPSQPAPPLANGFTSAYLLDESADSPSSLFLNDDFSSVTNDRRQCSWRRSVDM